MNYEPLLHIVLHQPEIPYNTGSVGRTCVAAGAKLWLVRPLGFRIDDYYLRRAGLDYWEHLEWEAVDDWSALVNRLPDTRALLLHQARQAPLHRRAILPRRCAGLWQRVARTPAVALAGAARSCLAGADSCRSTQPESLEHRSDRRLRSPAATWVRRRALARFWLCKDARERRLQFGVLEGIAGALGHLRQHALRTEQHAGHLAEYDA